MKRWIGALCALLMLPALACGEAYTIGEVREQVEALGRWTQTYTDDYGRRIAVDVEPMIADVERVPVLMMDSPVISEENVYNAFPRESVKVSLNHGEYEYTCVDEESGADVSVSLIGSGNPTFPTPECGDINIDYEFPQSRKPSNSSELIVYDGFFTLPSEIDMDASYLGENELTVREGVDLIEKRLSAFFPDYDLQLELFRFGLVKADKPYYSLTVRQVVDGIPILMASKDCVLNTSEEKLGIKPLKEWGLNLRLQYGTFDKPTWVGKVSQNRFSILCRPLKVSGVLLEDVPLCSMEKVMKTLESRIQKGYIRNVYSLRFGYCCYFDGDGDIVLYPVWEIECDYMFKPKKNMMHYKENEENPVTSRLYYRTMIVNAQTGEFMDPIELRENLLDCPEIITWEDVQQ